RRRTRRPRRSPPRRRPGSPGASGALAGGPGAGCAGGPGCGPPAPTPNASGKGRPAHYPALVIVIVPPETSCLLLLVNWYIVRSPTWLLEPKLIGVSTWAASA